MDVLDLGRVAITLTANAVLSIDAIGICLFLHANMNFGNLSESDRKRNLEDIKNKEGRVLSRYKDIFSGNDFYIITDLTEEGNITTIMLREEY